MTNDYKDNKHLITYRCVIGSRAYGLHTAASDFDKRGFYVAKNENLLGLEPVPEQLNDGEDTYWEIGKFVNLALKANPNILETLWTPLVDEEDIWATLLRKERGIFISKRVYHTYRGYALSQLKKVDKHYNSTGDINWKNAMHLIRLMLSGIHALKYGDVLVDMKHQREELLNVRNGKYTWEIVKLWWEKLEKDLDKAFKATILPDEPDTKRANEILLAIRASRGIRSNLQ